MSDALIRLRLDAAKARIAETRAMLAECAEWRSEHDAAWNAEAAYADERAHQQAHWDREGCA